MLSWENVVMGRTGPMQFGIQLIVCEMLCTFETAISRLNTIITYDGCKLTGATATAGWGTKPKETLSIRLGPLLSQEAMDQ